MKITPTSKMLKHNADIRQRLCSLSITVMKVPVRLITELAILTGSAVKSGILIYKTTKFIEDDN